MEYKIVCYTPKWHERLLAFMHEAFPHRDIRYLDWWLTNVDTNEDCWEKSGVVLDNDRIIACSPVNGLSIASCDGRSRIFSGANFIVSSEYRGKGISRLIYERYDFPGTLSVGFTDIGWKIQPKYIKDFTPINPINVYLSLSMRGMLCSQIWRILSRRTLTDMRFPSRLNLGKGETLVLCASPADLQTPADGRWMGDALELVRDASFIRKRYEDIYCKERYKIYQYLSNGRFTGYVVLRKTVYKGFDMISLVDFRFKNRSDEPKALRAAVKTAGRVGIGLVITLTTRRWGHRLLPLTLMTGKKLNCALGTREDKEKYDDILITSADSDLDFVYYR